MKKITIGYGLQHDVVVKLKEHIRVIPKRCDLKIERILRSFLFFSLLFSGEVDSLDHLMGSNTPDPMMEIGAIDQPEPQKQIWCEKKEAAVHEEMRRMNKLPANSTYVTHRLKVLNKILQLISIQRTVAQEQELELLFAGLSL